MASGFEGRNVQLIKLVRTHPELYDQQHSRYHDAQHKTKVWNTIGALLEEDGLACKSRWKNIRDQYKKNVRKHGMKKTAYKFKEHLSFLKDFEEKSSQSANDSDPDDDFLNELFPEKELTASEASADKQVSGPRKSNTRFTSSSKHPEWDQLSGNATINSPRVMEYLLQRLEGTQNPNPVDVFLAGIAPALKILQPYDWNQAKLEIFSIVHKYELKMLTDPTPLCNAIQYQNGQATM